VRQWRHLLCLFVISSDQDDERGKPHSIHFYVMIATTYIGYDATDAASTAAATIVTAGVVMHDVTKNTAVYRYRLAAPTINALPTKRVRIEKVPLYIRSQLSYFLVIFVILYH